MTTEQRIPNEIRTVILSGEGYLMMTSAGDYKQALKELKADATKMYRHPEYPRDLFFAKKMLDALEFHKYDITEDNTCIELHDYFTEFFRR